MAFHKFVMKQPMDTHYGVVKSFVGDLLGEKMGMYVVRLGFTTKKDEVIEHIHLIDKSFVKSLRRCRTETACRGNKEWYQEYKW